MSTMTQNEVTNALTEAIQTISQSTTNAKEATLVVEAEITKVIDAGIGTYKVKYLGNIFEATTAHTEIEYSIGDMVYIIIPNGDFGKNKIILSPVTPSTAVYATTKDKETYITIGDNLFAFVDDVSLCTYKPHDADPIGTDPSPYVNIDTTGFDTLFKAALADSRTFNLTCKIRTNIEKERRSKGNYGIILDIPIIQIINGTPTNNYYSIVIDINNITGDPYNLSVPALQNFYFTLPDEMEYDETKQPRIRSFVVGFLGEDDTKPDDIFITDIKVLSTLVIDSETMAGYYATITASEGNSFLSSRTNDSKILTAIIYLNGKVTNISNFDCYWFKENSAIDTTNDKFQRFGGVGWEILNKVSQKNISDDGTISYQYVTNNYTQLISQTDVHFDTRFKCILVKGETIVSSIVTIKNLASSATLELSSLTGSNIFSAGTGSVDLQLKYYELGITNVTNPNFNIGYSWQRLDKNGNYLDNNFYVMTEYNTKIDNTLYTRISYPVSQVDESNTIACTAYIDTPSSDGTSVKRQTIGTVWLNIVIGEPSNGMINVANGDKLYKYDADGDSPMVADYDGPLSSAIKEIDPLYLTLYKADGTQFTDAEYAVTTITWLVPIKSMITLDSEYKTDIVTNPGYYTIKGNYKAGYSTLAYGIANTYNKSKLDNTILVRASAPSAVLSDVLSTSINLRFLKDGESGTNGTKYSAILTYEGKGYAEKGADGKPYKLQLIYAGDTKKWYLYNPAHPSTYTVFSSARLRASLYVDGTLNSTSPTAVWEIFDNSYNNAEDNIVCPITINNGVISLTGASWTDTTKNFCATVQAKVSAKQTSTLTSQTNSDEYVYAYYPIECSYIAKESYILGCLTTMEGGFSKVLYASDGTNPQYDNSEPFYINNYLYDEDISDLYNYSWESSSNMRVRANSASTCSIVPTSKYDNGVAKNFVRTKMTRTDTQTSSIREKRTLLQEELTAAQNKLSYYNLLQNNLDFFTIFDYNSYINKLTSAAMFYKAKTNIINAANKMLEQLELVQNSCNIYLRSNGQLDTRIQNVLNEVEPLLIEVKKLVTLSYKLGTESGVINSIKAIVPSTVVINNKIAFLDGIPGRGCYFSINSAIDTYNNIVNSIYKTYYNDLISSLEVKNNEAVVLEVMNSLNVFANNSKLTTLASSHYGYNEQVYRYSSLSAILKARIKSAAAQLDTYSYALVLDNVVIPMYKDISWYINFYNDGGYAEEINSIGEEILLLQNKISVLDSMLTPGNNVLIIHVKPIIMLYNRYEMSNINGWDGNKLETGDGYLLAPQVGAGAKNNTNQFTGIVIGVKQVSEKSKVNQQIGLFGYSSGVQSIFLNAENGSATFGVSGKGQIIIEPSSNKAIIKSGNYSTSAKTGMQIDLTTPEIKFGSGNFVVNSFGHITAKGGGSIAGWNIKDTQLYSNVSEGNGRITLESSGQGKIYSHSHNTLASQNTGFYLSSDGLSVGNTIRVTAAQGGKLEIGRLSGSRYWTINGNSSNSYISYGTNSFNTTANSVYIGTNGISFGQNDFYYNTSNNKCYINGEIHAREGTIGQGNNIFHIGGTSGTTDKAFIYTNYDYIGADNNIYIGTDGLYLGTSNSQYMRYTSSDGFKVQGGNIEGSSIKGGSIKVGKTHDTQGSSLYMLQVDDEEAYIGDFMVTTYNNRQILESYDEETGISPAAGNEYYFMWAGYTYGTDGKPLFAVQQLGDYGQIRVNCDIIFYPSGWLKPYSMKEMFDKLYNDIDYLKGKIKELENDMEYRADEEDIDDLFNDEGPGGSTSGGSGGPTGDSSDPILGG